MAKKLTHQTLVDRLFDRLKDRPYIDEIYKNYVYDRGECDILAKQGGYVYLLPQSYWVYYEVKSRYCERSYMKAEDQLFRFCTYPNFTFPKFDPDNEDMTRYGVLVTPQRIKIMCRNNNIRTR